jgi:integrase
LGVGKDRANQLLRAARSSCPCDALLVLLMLELGLRVSEAVAVGIGDLSEQGRHQVLRVKGKGQATKATIVPLNPVISEAIAAATAGRSSGPLLINERGLQLSRQQAGRRVKALGAQIGIPELHPHALRHAFVTLALDEGASLRDVQDGARHADPRTTRRYDRNRMNLDRHPTHLLGAVLEH